MRMNINRSLAGPLAATFALALGACGSTNMENRSLYSVKQPVIERANYTIDVATAADGLPLAEQQRLAGWFESMELRYGDRLSVESAVNDPAVQEDVAALAGRYGILITDGAPVTEGFVGPGQARIVLTRSTASVPDCPDWSHTQERNPHNATNPNYGCAINSNIAAMVANPEDLVEGQRGTGETIVTTSTKAIRAYRDQAPTGVAGLPEVSSKEGGN